MNDPKVLGVVRHILTLVGGLLVSFGVLNDDSLGQITEAIMGITGGVLILVSFFKSWNAKEKAK